MPPAASPNISSGHNRCSQSSIHGVEVTVANSRAVKAELAGEYALKLPEPKPSPAPTQGKIAEPRSDAGAGEMIQQQESMVPSGQFARTGQTVLDTRATILGERGGPEPLALQVLPRETEGTELMAELPAKTNRKAYWSSC
jgi:hypothetical protein